MAQVKHAPVRADSQTTHTPVLSTDANYIRHQPWVGVNIFSRFYTFLKDERNHCESSEYLQMDIAIGLWQTHFSTM